MYLLIVLLPLMGCTIAGFFGRAIGPHGAQIVTITGVSGSALLSCLAFYEVGLCGSPCYVHLFTWMDSELFYVSWGLMVDSVTVVMLILVTFVSTLVHIYAVSYMSADPHIPRFMAYLSFFTFFMLSLVTADNMIQLFFGWEGVGLCSYLLINFWYTRLQANKSAIKAVLVNRVGDFGLALGIMGVFFLFQSVDFATIFSTADSFYANQVGEGYQPRHIFLMGEWESLDLVCCLLFVGAVGKSAQLGLHTWLPDAMEGPTPVSALIHAATMVTAGVFMIIRCSPLFEYAPNALLVITFFGAMTAFFAATTGLLQNDLKRVIAYSTCSQLGYMVFACGISNYSVSLFHLANHGFFKALLFLSAGSVIHAMTDEQDMRQMGGLAQMIPFTYVMMTIGSLSLMGFPFMTGFYSKDVILELAYSKYSLAGSFAHWLGSLAAFFTAFYSFRLIALTFLVKTNAQKTRLSHVHDAPFFLGFPLFCLAFGSIFLGYLTKDMMIGLGTHFWNQSIYIAPHHMNMVDAEFIPTSIKWVPVVLSFIGAGSALVAYGMASHLLYRMKMPSSSLEPTFVPHTRSLGNHVYSFFNQKWYVDKIYNSFLVVPALNFGYNVSFRLLDRGVFEMLGPYGLRESFSLLSQRASSLQSGYLYNYAFVMLLGVTLFLAFGAIQTFGLVFVPYREFAFLVVYLIWLFMA